MLTWAFKYQQFSLRQYRPIFVFINFKMQRSFGQDGNGKRQLHFCYSHLSHIKSEISLHFLKNYIYWDVCNNHTGTLKKELDTDFLYPSQLYFRLVKFSKEGQN